MQLWTLISAMAMVCGNLVQEQALWLIMTTFKWCTRVVNLAASLSAGRMQFEVTGVKVTLRTSASSTCDTPQPYSLVLKGKPKANITKVIGASSSQSVYCDMPLLYSSVTFAKMFEFSRASSDC